MFKNSKNRTQDYLNRAALVSRKFNLGDEKYFFSKFSDADKIQLKEAWGFGQKKIQNREIIKDSSNLDAEENKIANERASGFIDTETIFLSLNSEFDVKKLKLSEENFERRFRHILAEKYITIVSTQVFSWHEKASSTTRVKAISFFGKYKTAFIILTIFSAFSAPRIIDGLTPVDVLTQKIHENSKYKFDGSICNDGSTSHSQGRGTCSWHGGVNYKFYKGDYKKSIEECKEEAIKISWRD